MCVLGLLYSNITFYITFVKLYLTLLTEIEGIEVEPALKPAIELIRELISEEFTSEELANKLMPLLVKCSRGQPRKNLAIIVFLQDNIYKDSCYIEIIRFLKKGVFKVTFKFKVLKGIRIFNS